MRDHEGLCYSKWNNPLLSYYLWWLFSSHTFERLSQHYWSSSLWLREGHIFCQVIIHCNIIAQCDAKLKRNHQLGGTPEQYTLIDWWKCYGRLVNLILSLFCLPFSISYHRSGVAMPFGCLTIGEKKDYNNPSDVTDKYDLGQIVKSWVSQLLVEPDAIHTDFWKMLYLFLRNHYDVIISLTLNLNASFQGGVLWDIQGQG